MHRDSHTDAHSRHAGRHGTHTDTDRNAHTGTYRQARTQEHKQIRRHTSRHARRHTGRHVLRHLVFYARTHAHARTCARAHTHTHLHLPIKRMEHTTADHHGCAVDLIREVGAACSSVTRTCTPAGAHTDGLSAPAGAAWRQWQQQR